MALTPLQKRLAPLAFPFNLPSEEALRVDISDRDFRILLLQAVCSAGSGGAGLPFGADRFTVTMYGSTNNIQTVVYKLGATVLKTMTLTYFGGGVADDDKIQSGTFS